jgi:hypothetical protein
MRENTVNSGVAADHLGASRPPDPTRLALYFQPLTDRSDQSDDQVCRCRLVVGWPTRPGARSTPIGVRYGANPKRRACKALIAKKGRRATNSSQPGFGLLADSNMGHVTLRRRDHIIRCRSTADRNHSTQPRQPLAAIRNVIPITRPNISPCSHHRAISGVKTSCVSVTSTTSVSSSTTVSNARVPSHICFNSAPLIIRGLEAALSSQIVTLSSLLPTTYQANDADTTALAVLACTLLRTVFDAFDPRLPLRGGVIRDPRNSYNRCNQGKPVCSARRATLTRS